MANPTYVSVLWALAFIPIFMIASWFIYVSYLMMRRTLFGIVTEATVTRKYSEKRENQDYDPERDIQPRVYYYIEYVFWDEREFISNQYNEKLLSSICAQCDVEYSMVSDDIINLIIEYMGISFYYGPYTIKQKVLKPFYDNLSPDDVVTIKYDPVYKMNAEMVSSNFYHMHWDKMVVALLPLGFIVGCIYGITVDMNDYPFEDKIIILLIMLFVSIPGAICIWVWKSRKHKVFCFREKNRLQIDHGV